MFEKISIHTPRQFVTEELNPGDWPSLEPLFDQLERQMAEAQRMKEEEDISGNVNIKIIKLTLCVPT